MEEWKEFSVHDITRRVKVGFVGSCENDYCNKTETDAIPMIRTTDLTNYIIHFDNQKFVTRTFHEKNIKSQLHKHDLLIARHGDNGKTCIYESDEPANCLNVIIIEPDNNKCDYKFLKYMFDSSSVKNILSGTLVGSVQPVLNTKTVENLIIKIPPLPTQQKIAAILSSLDDKIELNNKINENLEQQAQDLFKSWFIDFELFDGKLPEGWKNGTLSDISTYSSDKIDVSDLTLSTYYSTENMLPNKMGIEDASSLPTIKQTTRCNPGETIISNIRPYFKKIYYCSEEIAGCSTDVLCFKPRNPNYSEYLYQTLYSDAFFAYMVLGSKGTKMPRGDKQQIMNYSITIPDEQYLLKYKTFAKPIFFQIDSKRKENKRLSELRDTLLPKLMNGEIIF